MLNSLQLCPFVIIGVDFGVGSPGTCPLDNGATMHGWSSSTWDQKLAGTSRRKSRGRQHSCCFKRCVFKVRFLLFLCYFNSCHSVFCTPSQDTG